MKKIIVVSLIIISIIAFSGCRQIVEDEKFERDLFALDTYITFTVFGGEEVKPALDAAIERMLEIEALMSVTVEESDVSLINQNAGIQPVRVHDDTFYVIKKALYYGELTDGAFDISVYPIVALWDIKAEDPRIPSHEAIMEKLALVDYKKIVIDESEKTVFLQDEGMMIDLGGIAKGYVGDEAIQILKEHGIKHALVNLGGDILSIGVKTDGTRWRIGVQDPRGNQRSHFAIVEIDGETIVSSGDYERYMISILEETGERYHHIFDPRTGYPAATGLISTTIVGPSAIDTDALSTSFFIMGLDAGLQMIKELDATHGIAVTEDKSVYITDGFYDRTRINNPDYKLAD